MLNECSDGAGFRIGYNRDLLTIMVWGCHNDAIAAKTTAVADQSAS
jgi:hypothetical protein